MFRSLTIAILGLAFACMPSHAAIVGKDDRAVRTAADDASFDFNLESAQGRIYCLPVSATAPPSIPSLSYLQQHFTQANAALVFDDETIIVSRHVFVEIDGTKGVDPNECYFEHIATGQLISIVQVAMAPYKRPVNSTSNDRTAYWSGDYALARLAQPVAGGVAIPRGDVRPAQLGQGTKVKVISNLAINPSAAMANNPYALTIAHCVVRGVFEGALASSDCSAGPGSSGAQVYSENAPRSFDGLVFGGNDAAPPGSGYKLGVLDTGIVMFTSLIFTLYDQLPRP